MGRFLKTVVITLVAMSLAFTSLAGVSGAAAQDDGPTITVGSKDFTESIILAEMVAALLEDAGYTVERQLNLGGTAVVHQALVNGEIDIYVEYTGTGLLAILGQELPSSGSGATPAAAGATPVASSGTDQVYQIVKEQYQEEFGLTWLQPWGFNNTYALAVTQETAEEYDLQTISDLEGVAGDLTFGATQEFLVRDDGLPGLEETYGIEFGDDQGLDPGLLYSALDGGEVDIISAFATDGRIPALDLVLLEDDMNYFPPYYAAPVVDTELLEQNPEIADILNQLAGQIDDATMADLNYRVDEGGEDEAAVAQSYLEEQGLIGSGS